MYLFDTALPVEPATWEEWPTELRFHWSWAVPVTVGSSGAPALTRAASAWRMRATAARMSKLAVRAWAIRASELG